MENKDGNNNSFLSYAVIILSPCLVIATVFYFLMDRFGDLLISLGFSDQLVIVFQNKVRVFMFLLFILYLALMFLTRLLFEAYRRNKF
jgi:hypothetical protein